MTEAQIITKTVLYLIREENFVPKTISIRTIKEKEKFKQSLAKANIDQNTIDKITFSRDGADIIGDKFGKDGEKLQKNVSVEAKGGDVKYFYHFYAILGQFMLGKKESDYYPFAMALPKEWREKVKIALKDKTNEIKPVVKLIMDNYKGLSFMFVSDETVEKITWKDFLK